MKKAKKLSIILTAALVLMTFAACRSETNDNPDKASLTDSSSAVSGSVSTESSEEENSIYRLKNYENSVISDIRKVEAGNGLDEFCTTYKFTYLSDGLLVDGYISIPLSIEKTQKPGKCVMLNHGGNRDFGILEDKSTASFCYICDRIVVASQYRGCGGSEGEDDFGGENLNDVINLIDLCENNFSFIDMDDFCVAGASRGGVMTYPAARKDKRIKRIIALSAVTDLVELYGIREDKMREVLVETIGFTPEQNREEYEKRSAIYWADEIKVPVLMFHSKGDTYVPYSQAEKLYNMLKDSTDCTLITYDDDNHSIVQKEDYQTIRDFLNQK